REPRGRVLCLEHVRMDRRDHEALVPGDPVLVGARQQARLANATRRCSRVDSSGKFHSTQKIARDRLTAGGLLVIGPNGFLGDQSMTKSGVLAIDPKVRLLDRASFGLQLGTFNQDPRKAIECGTDGLLDFAVEIL